MKIRNVLTIFLVMLCYLHALAEDNVSATIEKNKICVSLNNTTSFVAFQIDIILPEGIEASKVIANEGRLWSLNVASGSKIEYSCIADSVFRVIAYNQENRRIADASGELFTVLLSNSIDSTTKIKLSNVIFVKADDFEEMNLEDVVLNDNTLLGDVNNDGVVDVNDAVALICHCIAGTTSELPLNTSDVYEDGEINFKDAQAIMQIYVKSDD